MRKSIQTVFALLLASLICIAAFCGCAWMFDEAKLIDGGTYMPNPETNKVLSPETEKQIRQTYLDNFINSYAPEYEYIINHFRIDYYIVVNNCVVVSIGLSNPVPGDYIPLLTFVASEPFRLNPGMHTLVWKDGQLYGLDDAYNLGILPEKNEPDNIGWPVISEEFLDPETEWKIMQYHEASGVLLYKIPVNHIIIVRENENGYIGYRIRGSY